MPYRSLTDLPEGVQAHLPKHGQEIYKEAFNHAYSEYKGRTDHEELCHKVAWSAVKNVYIKNANGKWIKKSTD